MSAHRPEFTEAITLLAKGIAELTRNGFESPILVGGAAVEFYTSSAVTSGDFDLVTPYQDALEVALKPYGFVRDSGASVLIVGRQLYHPRLGFGVQVVSGQLMDGRANREKILVVDIGGATLNIIPVEDLIADRMGQAFADTVPREDMLDQARKLLALSEDIDETYLDKRIADETAGAARLADLKRVASLQK